MWGFPLNARIEGDSVRLITQLIEIIEGHAPFFEGILSCSDGSIIGIPRPPDLAGLAQMITGLPQEERPRRERGVPGLGMKNGTRSGPEKVPSGHQRTAAGGAGRRIDESMPESDATPGDFINTGSPDDMVDRGTRVQPGVGARVTAPVVRKHK